nr:uncharacterized protein LOC117278215 [Nicotiana tomentosiformis]
MPLAAKEVVLVSGTIFSVWTLFMDGVSNVKYCGFGIVLITPLGEILRQTIRTVPLTNNEAKYKSIVIGVELVRGLGSERSFQGLLARCLGPTEDDYVMREVHEGVCGNHCGADSLVLKLTRDGFSPMEQDAKVFVQKCDKCQYYAQLVNQLSELLHSMVSHWPFMKWGMDIVGSLPQGPGQVKFILTLTDYFTKWVEAGAFKKVGERKVMDFI